MKKKSKGVGGEDRISSLPDPLLLHILSFLNDTKQTVKTCVLSKRWQFVWTDMLEINIRQTHLLKINIRQTHLKEKSTNDEKLGRFVDAVGRMIAMCRSLNKFAVEFSYEKRFASNVNHWVNLAIRHKVKDITLRLSGFNERYQMPQMLYSHSSLSSLYVSYCDMAAPLGIIAWKSLKSLTLEGMELSDVLIENILSSCPILKTLKLNSFRGLNNLKIHSPNLTTLVLSNISDKNIVDISAPYLRVLTIVGDYKFTDVSSVVQATINLRTRYYDASNISTINHIKQLFQSLKSVEILELDCRCSEIISKLEAESWVLPLFTNLRSLRLHVFRSEMSILYILASSPNLKTLCIQGYWIHYERYTHLRKTDFHQYEVYAKNCNMDNLKTAELNYSSGLDEHILAFVQILLKYAKSLEKIVIHLSAPSSRDSNKSMEIATRLRTFHRASPNCSIVLHQCQN